MMIRTTIAATVAFTAAFTIAFSALPARAADVTAGSLKISAAWARATPKGAKVGGGYLTVTNTGSAPDRLVGGTAAIARDIEVHEMKMEQGVMKMRMLGGGLEIKPGATVTLQPGGYHLMFMGLKQPLQQGEQLKATLQFEKAGKVEVDFEVRGLGAGAGKPAGHGGGAMPGMKH